MGALHWKKTCETPGHEEFKLFGKYEKAKVFFSDYWIIDFDDGGCKYIGSGSSEEAVKNATKHIAKRCDDKIAYYTYIRDNLPSEKEIEAYFREEEKKHREASIIRFLESIEQDPEAKRVAERWLAKGEMRCAFSGTPEEAEAAIKEG